MTLLKTEYFASLVGGLEIENAINDVKAKRDSFIKANMPKIASIQDESIAVYNVTTSFSNGNCIVLTIKFFTNE